MKTTRQHLILAISVAAALGLSACSNNESPPADTGAEPSAMSAEPTMPPVTEPPPMGSASTVMPAEPATTSSAGMN